MTTRQPLWDIVCRLPKKGRIETEEIVEQMKERDRGEIKMNESEETEEINPISLYRYLLQGWQVLPSLCQYQLDAPVT